MPFAPRCLIGRLPPIKSFSRLMQAAQWRFQSSHRPSFRLAVQLTCDLEPLELSGDRRQQPDETNQSAPLTRVYCLVTLATYADRPAAAGRE